MKVCIELVLKTCKCGCEQNWLATVDSKSLFASQSCEESYYRRESKIKTQATRKLVMPLLMGYTNTIQKPSRE